VTMWLVAEGRRLLGTDVQTVSPERSSH
jgi:hypothetical protein